MSDAAGDREGTGKGSGLPPEWPHPIFNWMTGIGVALFAVMAAASIFLVLMVLVVGESSGYGGLTLLPLVVLSLFGLGLVLAGWLRERWRQKHGRHSSFFESWVVDPWAFVRSRGAWFVPLVLAAGTFALLGTGAASVGVVQYSESNSFCTDACHAVMGPEGAVYPQTTHSRIDCVECHVGPGPEGFLSAKLGGLRQLYHFATGAVTKPISTPVHGRAIGRELCEGCHAPDREVAMKARVYDYFLAGEDVDPVHLAMIVKVRGAGNGLLPGEGSHYHMQIAGKVEYVARDEKRQDIAWVKLTDRDGKTREFDLESDALSEEQRATLPARSMECIDCHSRPAHRFRSAIDSVNEAIGIDRLSRDMPGIKEASVQALDGEYDTTAEALEGIESHLREFYEDEYPEILEDRADEFLDSVAALRAIYETTIFPEMKADWRAHPDNVGHRDWPGCFRCHNEEMVDSDGTSITTECSSCHAILSQSESSESTMEGSDVGEPFVHPEDGSELEEFTLCSDCHTGGKELFE